MTLFEQYGEVGGALGQALQADEGLALAAAGGIGGESLGLEGERGAGGWVQVWDGEVPWVGFWVGGIL